MLARIFTLTIAVGTAAILATGAFAQSDPIAARKALMKAQGDQSRIATRMLRGEAPFDPAAAEGVFKNFLETGEKFGALFPENSRTGDTRAAAAIWTDRAGFDAALAKFIKDVKDNSAKTKSLDDFKVAMSVVGGNCGSCHEKFRTR